MSPSDGVLVIPFSVKAQIEDLKHQHLERLKKLWRKADVERDNDTLRKENERLGNDLDDARARALEADDQATDLWGQKETVEYENRDLKRLVARLQKRIKDLTDENIGNRAKVEISHRVPAVSRRTSPSTLKAQSTGETVPDIINLIDDDHHTGVVSTSKAILPASAIIKMEPSEGTVGVPLQVMSIIPNFHWQAEVKLRTSGCEVPYMLHWVLLPPASASVRSTRNAKKRQADINPATAAALNDEDTRPRKRTRNAHSTAESYEDPTARIEIAGSVSTSSGSPSRASAPNIDGLLDDEFDPNNMAFDNESTALVTDATEPQRDYFGSSGAVKSGTQLGGSLITEADLKIENGFDSSDLLSVDDGFHEDASRTEKRKVGSALAKSSDLLEIYQRRTEGPDTATIPLTRSFRFGDEPAASP
ncbi:uncharacterized protein ARMOST_13759 [Armillaria ostoyae]|uniref:Uncharacterized protein n=1 Tax=Armillaria ostoyae TaxID=47428 RepID=A0A284RNM0_ARMOS|nr:uncharacterized protein ARMOST_13759 [Armillaria ostoyae]